MKLCAITLTVAVTTLSAADVVRCPPAIQVRQQLAAPVRGWTASTDAAPIQLSGLTFFEGRPEDQASLAPDERKGIATWTFGSGQSIWVMCHYSGTSVTLTRQLPPNTSKCEVTYRTNVTIAGLPVIEKIDCVISGK